jgi:hypothetical protein
VTITGPSSFTAAQIRATSAVRGVSQVLPVSVNSGQLGSGQYLSVVAASPVKYARLIAATPLPAVPARFADVGASGGVIPVLASPGLAAKLGSRPIRVSFRAGSERLTVQVVAPGRQHVGDTHDQPLWRWLPGTAVVGAAERRAVVDLADRGPACG